MPKGIPKHKKTKAQRHAIALQAAKTRAANRRAQEAIAEQERQELQAKAARAARLPASGGRKTIANAKREDSRGIALSPRPKLKRFLSDAEKGTLVSYFFSKPGQTYSSWDAVARAVGQDTGVQVSPQQARRLREAFSLPFEVAGATDGDSACEQRLRRIEAMLAHIQQRVDSWTDEA